MNGILKEDIANLLARKDLDLSRLAGSTVFVTGATGLIGSNLLCALREAGKRRDPPIRILALARDPAKAAAMFGTGEHIHFLAGDVTEPLSVGEKIDYIVHGAGVTGSLAFVEDPVGVMRTAVKGTANILALAREKGVSAMVYLSSMEVYGAPETETKITEDRGARLDPMKARSSYPESKRLCECLCAAYASQYGVPVKVVRLAQTFGPGVRCDDGRVFAEFARCVLDRKNIVLHTDGETKRDYLYTADAAAAILTVLLDGKPGEAYNAANEDTFCSVRELGELFCSECAAGEIGIELRREDEAAYGYAPRLTMDLDTGKLRALGWRAEYGLAAMAARLCETMGESRSDEGRFFAG